VGDLFRPRQLAAALGRPFVLVLALTGTAAVAYESFIGHPEIVRFATAGRLVVGQVYARPAPNNPYRDRLAWDRSRIAVEDPELGPKVVEVYGPLPIGQRVPVLCLTPARRCMGADVVKERLDLWPLTPVMLTGATELALAGLLWAATRRRLLSKPASPESRWKQTAIERALSAFRETRQAEPMGAHVLRLGEDEAIVRVMVMAGHIPPDRVWFAVRRDGTAPRELTYTDVASLEGPWR
jgi:hypothetical protein